MSDRHPPSPDECPEPSYDGRPLPRPWDEVQDQGLGFDITTALNRRRVLGLFGAGGVALGLAGCGAASAATPRTSSASPSTATSDLGEIPDETAGPFPGDGSNGADALEQSGIVRSDITTSFGASTTRAEGVPMTLTLTITDLANGGAGFAGVAVYVWHCDRDGNYSMYSAGIENENYLRGVQLADTEGIVQFTSVFPACYAGRWPHIHFEVYPDRNAISDSSGAIATSQVALPEETCTAVYASTGYEKSVKAMSGVSLASDNVFGDDGGAAQLATASGDVSAGYAIALTVPVDVRTTPAAAPPTGAAPTGRRPR